MKWTGRPQKPTVLAKIRYIICSLERIKWGISPIPLFPPKTWIDEDGDHSRDISTILIKGEGRVGLNPSHERSKIALQQPLQVSYALNSRYCYVPMGRACTRDHQKDMHHITESDPPSEWAPEKHLQWSFSWLHSLRWSDSVTSFWFCHFFQKHTWSIITLLTKSQTTFLLMNIP